VEPLREKRRYVLVFGSVDEELDRIRQLFGQTGWETVGPRVMFKGNGWFVIRVSNKGMNKLRAANFLTENRIADVSGSIKRMKSRNKQLFERAS